MWRCDDGVERLTNNLNHKDSHTENLHLMKKFMTLMLGLSLLSGVAAFAQDKPADTTSTTKKTKKSKKSKKTATTTSTTSSAK